MLITRSAFVFGLAHARRYVRMNERTVGLIVQIIRKAKNKKEIVFVCCLLTARSIRRTLFDSLVVVVVPSTRIDECVIIKIGRKMIVVGRYVTCSVLSLQKITNLLVS